MSILASMGVWIAVKFSFGKNLTDWIGKYALRNKPQSIKEKYNDAGVLIEREQIYR